MDKAKRDSSSINDEELFNTTLAVIEDLADLLDEETTIVRRQDIPALQELMKRKAKLVVSYQSNIKCMVRDGVISRLSKDMSQRLNSAGEKIAIAGEKNALMIKSAVQATQLLINNVIEKIKQEALPRQGYNDLGNGMQNQNLYSPTCRPVAVSRTA